MAGPEKHRRSLQKIIPDLLIDGRYLKQNLAGPGFDALAAIRTTPGPYESVLNGFGKVLAPVVGAFAEMPSDVHLLTDLIASAQAADHCEYFAALPSEIRACS